MCVLEMVKSNGRRSALGASAATMAYRIRKEVTHIAQPTHSKLQCSADVRGLVLCAVSIAFICKTANDLTKQILPVSSIWSIFNPSVIPLCDALMAIPAERISKRQEPETMANRERTSFTQESDSLFCSLHTSGELWRVGSSNLSYQ